MNRTVPLLTGDDPLAPVGSRFSLPAAYENLPFSDEQPSGPRTRPFVLRVAGAPAPSHRDALPASRYCPDRQITITDDPAGVPLYRLRFERTTVASKDGSSTPMEDWKPDLPQE